MGGMVAYATGHSLAAMTVQKDQAGGIYSFLRDLGYFRTARISAWILLFGYVLTSAVYAYTFGAYLGNAIGGPGWLPRAMAAFAIVVMAAINLRSAGQAAGFEIFIVVVKLTILAGLAAIGLSQFEVGKLAITSQPGALGIVIGAASVFMAYEGFELLAYDYMEMKDRKRTMQRIMPVTIGSAALIYVLVSLAIPMLTGTKAIIADGEVALATAGQEALGTFGLVAVTIAAAFSTGSAINATFFSSARLAQNVADNGELPSALSKDNGQGVPYWSVIAISGLSLVLAMVGGLSGLVNAASLVFLLVFGTVNYLAWHGGVKWSAISLAGMIGAFGALGVLLLHFANLI